MGNLFENKICVVTGCEGLIGKELVELLEEKGANIRHADLKEGIDLRSFNECLRVTEGADYVFHLMGVKGSPKMTNEKPADFFIPMIQCNTNLLEACRKNKVKGVLYTSSIAVLNPQSDKFPAWAKMTGEVQIESYRVQYPEFGNNCCIVRPSNVYGRYDKFDNPNSMVITSLIREAIKDKEIEIFGDGNEIRDFINSKDVAEAMILIMEKMPKEPINIGSGEGCTIKEVAAIISNLTGKKVIFSQNKAQGDMKRVIDIQNLKKLGFQASIHLKTGIMESLKYAEEYYARTPD